MRPAKADEFSGWESRRKHVTTRCMDAEHLEFANSAFDRVLCGFALWFFPDPHAVLREFMRVVKPGRILGLTTWPEDSPAGVVWRTLLEPCACGGRPGAARPGAPLFNTLDQIEGALQSVGFREIHTASEEHDFVYVDGDTWWATLWSVGARATLEQLAPAVLEQVKKEELEQLEAFRQPDGFHLAHRALFGFGTKSG